MAERFLKNVQKTIQWREDRLLINCAGTIGLPYMQKMNINISLTPHTKINSILTWT